MIFFNFTKSNLKFCQANPVKAESLN